MKFYFFLKKKITVFTILIPTKNFFSLAVFYVKWGIVNAKEKDTYIYLARSSTHILYAALIVAYRPEFF